MTIYSLDVLLSHLEPVRCSMSSSNCYFLTFIQLSQEAGHVVWCSSLFKIFSQFAVMTHWEYILIWENVLLFYLSGLTFRYLIHLEFIFVYGVRKCSSFIFLTSRWPVFPAPFVKKIVFSPLYILASFVKDRCLDLSLGFLFCFTDLYFCLCASTILSWWL